MDSCVHVLQMYIFICLQTQKKIMLITKNQLTQVCQCEVLYFPLTGVNRTLEL